MLFSTRRSQSAPDVALLNATDAPDAPAAPLRPGRSAPDLFRLSRRSAPAAGLAKATTAPAALVAPRSPSSRHEATCLAALEAAVKRDPRRDFYAYMATCRDAVHAVRDLVLHGAWRHPERLGALLPRVPHAEALTATAAGTLVGVLTCAVLEVATAKAEHSISLPRHRHRLGPAEQHQLQRLMNAVQTSLRALFWASPQRLRQLDILAEIPFDEDADPEMLRDLVKNRMHTQSVVEGQVQGFFHPVASLTRATARHFEPNADLDAFGASAALPPASAPGEQAKRLAEEMAGAVYALRLRAGPLASEDAGAVSGFMDKILALLQAHPGTQHWAVASELGRALRQPKLGEWRGRELRLMAALIYGATLRYAAQYLHQRHFESCRDHLVGLAQALGAEMHAWTEKPTLRTKLDVVSGLVLAGFRKRTPPLDIAANLGEYSVLRRYYKQARAAHGGSCMGEDPTQELLSKPLERVMLGIVMRRIEDILPLHPRHLHERDAF